MHATIIGAGIAGLALARGLRAVGFDVEIFEQAPELKPVGADIALAANGLRALRSLGLYEPVIERGEEIRRISVLDERGRTLETTTHLRLTERFGHVSGVTLHRSALHEALLSNSPTAILSERPLREGSGATLESTLDLAPVITSPAVGESPSTSFGCVSGSRTLLSTSAPSCFFLLGRDLFSREPTRLR